ncbi:DUF2786 domain-containing protein [Rhodococcus koreensis]|uniref:DUF2786 domain-containing protein n=1 Tax=Rhodococcus koreensis TaxID=99653 RepID=UPI0019813BEC|nr:DUF2786 domain-containing protein [Rhodococcus koreensis]QSE79170.1 DUF2786 domain-containing protein [Rhodococcus koreensis]
MSRNSQQNRAARKRKKQQRGHAREQRPPRPEVEGAESLVFAGIEFAYGPSANPESLQRTVRQLADLDGSRCADTVLDWVSRILDGSMDHVFGTGWQPTEFVHAVRREFGARTARLTVTVIGAHASRTSARKTAPVQWREQLDELGIAPDSAPARGYLSAWCASENADPTETWTAILSFLGYCSYLIPLTPLLATPANWGEGTVASSSAPRGPEPKVLSRIRGLLAKAEATTFAEEAETLSAKAQDLMTRYAIDSAVIDAHAHTSLTDQVVTRRLLVDNPYPEAKVQLLHCVAKTNNVRVLWHQRFGLVSMVGMPVDLDLSEMLFTSLLVQASHALSEAGGDRVKRSPSFRRSFLLAFATRIGERLTIAREQAGRDASSQYGKELVPIMAERSEAVGSVFEEQFPSVVTTSHSITNEHGWQAGRVAAELADLTGGRERITG